MFIGCVTSCVIRIRFLCSLCFMFYVYTCCPCGVGAYAADIRRLRLCPLPVTELPPKTAPRRERRMCPITFAIEHSGSRFEWILFGSKNSDRTIRKQLVGVCVQSLPTLTDCLSDLDWLLCHCATAKTTAFDEHRRPFRYMIYI